MRSHVAAFALFGSVVASPAEISDYEPVALGPATYCITYESTYLAPISIGANSSEIESSATDEPGFLPSDSTSLPLFESTQDALTTAATLNTEDPAANTEVSTVATDTLPVDTDQPTLTTIAPEDTEDPSLPAESTATQPVFEPTGQRVIFLVTPAGELTKRDVGGFVGNGNPDVCTFANVYTLGQGQLFVENLPFSYSGEEFQSLESASASLDGAITTTFSSDGGVLSFANRGLPGGRASFCQTPLDGQVYIIYRSRPSGCVFVTLTVYGVERCINGKIDGLDDTPTTNTTQSQDVTDSPITATDINVPEESETNNAETTEINVPRETEIDSPQTTEDNVPEQTETDTPDNTDTPPNVETTTGDGIDLPTLPTIRTSWSWVNTSFTAPPNAETTRLATSADVIEETTTADHLSDPNSSTATANEQTSPVDETSTVGELPDPKTLTATASEQTAPVDETSTVGDLPDPNTLTATASEQTAPVDETTTTVLDPNTSTTLEPTIGDPTSSTAETTTTIEAPIGTFFSLTQNGDFGIEDEENPPSNLYMWTPQGIASQLIEGCYKADGSLDNGCVTLGSTDSIDVKRAADSYSEIAQLITGLELEVSTYVLQFYYYVQTVSGSGCTLRGRGGGKNFATRLLVSSDVGSWKLARGFVVADVVEAWVRISLTCSPGSQANVRVDSVFVSNEVTIDNIDDYRLSFANEGGRGNRFT